MSIEFKEGAVCYADGKQWFAYDGYILNSERGEILPRDGLASAKDFKLNTIKQGDYIEASELDTEQKYNDVVEVLGLFGYEDHLSYSSLNLCDLLLVDSSGTICGCSSGYSFAKRKLTYSQIMAIGELKRLEIERDKPNSLESLVSCEDVVNKPSHYQFFEGVEVIEIIASSMTCEQFKGYCLGNRIKYRLRAGNKDKLEQEIAKSDKYVDLYDEHKHLCKNNGDLK